MLPIVTEVGLFQGRTFRSSSSELLWVLPIQTLESDLELVGCCQMLILGVPNEYSVLAFCKSLIVKMC